MGLLIHPFDLSARYLSDLSFSILFTEGAWPRPRCGSNWIRHRVDEAVRLKMQVRVFLFGPYASAAQAAFVDLNMPTGSRVAALVSALTEACPSIASMMPGTRFAVNHAFAEPSQVVHEADEVALIGMVSGG